MTHCFFSFFYTSTSWVTPLLLSPLNSPESSHPNMEPRSNRVLQTRWEVALWPLSPIPPWKLQWKTLLFPTGLSLPPKIILWWKLWFPGSRDQRRVPPLWSTHVASAVCCSEVCVTALPTCCSGLWLLLNCWAQSILSHCLHLFKLILHIRVHLRPRREVTPSGNSINSILHIFF